MQRLIKICILLCTSFTKVTKTPVSTMKTGRYFRMILGLSEVFHQDFGIAAVAQFGYAFLTNLAYALTRKA